MKYVSTLVRCAQPHLILSEQCSAIESIQRRALKILPDVCIKLHTNLLASPY